MESLVNQVRHAGLSTDNPCSAGERGKRGSLHWRAGLDSGVRLIRNFRDPPLLRLQIVTHPTG